MPATAQVPLGDRTYDLTRLSDGDRDSLDLWLRTRAIQMGRASIPPDADQETVDRLMEPVFRFAMGLMWDTDSGSVNGIERAIHVLWLMLRHEHRDIKESEVRRFAAEHNEQFLQALSVGAGLNGNPAKKATEETTAPPATTQPSEG